MYAKLENGRLIGAPKKLPGDGVNVWNPPEEMYLAQGWKPVTITDAPEAPEGHHYEPSWEETDEAIVQTWALVEDPDDIDASIEYLVSGHLIALPTEEADPDYLNEREPESEYFE